MGRTENIFIEPDNSIEKYWQEKNNTYSIPVSIGELDEFPTAGTPVKCGIPLPSGFLYKKEKVKVYNRNGQEVSVQSKVTGYWKDRSIKWLLLDFVAKEKKYRIEVGPDIKVSYDSCLQVEESEEGIIVNTGSMKMEIEKDRFAFPGKLWVDRNNDGQFTEDELVTNGGDVFLHLKDDNKELDGKYIADRDIDIEVEANGPVKATIRLSGYYYQDDKKVDPFIMRLYLYAGQKTIEIEHTLINNIDVSEVQTIAMGMDFPLILNDELIATTDIDGKRTQFESAADKTISALQINAEKKAYPEFNQFKPEYIIKENNEIVEKGNKSTGWISFKSKETDLSIGLRDMWQKYPKEYRYNGNEQKVEIYLQPDTGEPLDWYGGVDPEMIAPTGPPLDAFGEDGIAITHEIFLSFEKDENIEQAINFCAIPDALADPEWLAATKALGNYCIRKGNEFAEIEKVFDKMVDWLYLHQNEWFNWYGIVDYGGKQTMYQPHYGHWSNLTERWGWLGAEGEVEAGLGLYYMRTGSRKAFELMRSLNKHVMDLDYRHLGEYRGGGRRHFSIHWGRSSDPWVHTLLFGPTIFYHLYGDDRIRDTIDEVGELVLRYEWHELKVSRNTLNYLRAALWMYEITGKEGFKGKAKKMMFGLLCLQNKAGLFEHDKPNSAKNFWTNGYLLWGMKLYVRLIGSEEVREALIKVMDTELKPFGLEAHKEPKDQTHHKIWEGLQHAYLATGEKRFLWTGIRDLTTIIFDGLYERYHPVNRFPRSSYKYPHPEELKPESYTNMHTIGFRLLKIPYFLYAIKKAELENYRDLVDNSLNGIFYPWIKDPEDKERNYKTIDLKGEANVAPLSHDPFKYSGTEEAIVEHIPVDIEQNFKGLPWGTEVYYGSVPFKLSNLKTDDDKGIIALKKNEKVRISVKSKANKVYFLGQIIAKGDLERCNFAGRYIINYQDDSNDIIEWKNLINCEDWRYQHYSPEAPLVQMWAPKAFNQSNKNDDLVERRLQDITTDEEQTIINYAKKHPELLNQVKNLAFQMQSEDIIYVNASTCYHVLKEADLIKDEKVEPPQYMIQLYHINTLEVNTEGKYIEDIIFDAGDSEYLPVLMAVTVENNEENTDEDNLNNKMSNLVEKYNFGKKLDKKDYKYQEGIEEKPQCIASIPAYKKTDLELSLPETLQGKYRIEMLIDSNHPLSLDINFHDEKIVQDWHLIGSWKGKWNLDDNLQKIAFELDLDHVDFIKLGFEVDTGHGLYGDEEGATAWGLGWTWDQEEGKWYGPDSERWQEEYGPRWRLYQLSIHET